MFKSPVIQNLLEKYLFRRTPDLSTPIELTHRRIFIVPTGTGLLYVLVLITMLIGAINYLLSLGFALVFLLTGLGFVSIAHTFRNLIGLQVSPGQAVPVFAGDTAWFEIHLHNPRAYARHALDFSFEFEESVRCERIAENGSAVVRLPKRAEKRGPLVPGRITLKTTYPLGFCRAWSYPYPKVSLLVYPEPLERPLPWVSPYGEGQHDTHAAGLEDFDGFRLRQPNDPPKHIAWKIFARQAGDAPLLVKQFSGGSDTELMLDWALFPSYTDIEDRLSILTGWVLAAEREQLRYGLRLPENEVPPGQGFLHRERCLSALALYGYGADYLSR